MSPSFDLAVACVFVLKLFVLVLVIIACSCVIAGIIFFVASMICDFFE